ncbi:MAG: CotH kinase family protein, partial [Anaerovoracaceae bacterium]
MLDKKYFPKCIIALTVLSLILVFSVLLFPDSFFASEVQEDSGMVMGYEDTLFDTSQVLQIDISMEEDQWQDLLDNAISEEFYPCDVTVNGTLYENVGIRAKGNTSLSMVVSSDSDRYSFKLKFDEYVVGQNCCGLTSLILNNNYSDATLMKEALCY